MPGSRGITLDGPDGPRWNLALTLIDSGEAPVRLGGVEVSRNVAGPDADGVTRMIVTVAEGADRAVGLTALEQGRRVVEDVARSDARFAQLLDKYSYRWEVVADYGMGTLLLGEAEPRGDLVWYRS